MQSLLEGKPHKAPEQSQRPFRLQIVPSRMMASVMFRVASKMVPNRLIFGDSFDRPGTREVFWFQNKQSPSLERGRQGDCGCTNRTAPSNQKASSVWRQPFKKPSLVPPRPHSGFANVIYSNKNAKNHQKLQKTSHFSPKKCSL
jgi:hypothetical protein